MVLLHEKVAGRDVLGSFLVVVGISMVFMLP
jgi:drug/metabolite transporter (DMT)-like permease